LDSNAETGSEAVDEQLIILLAEGRSHVSAAVVAGCSAKRPCPINPESREAVEKTFFSIPHKE